MNLNPETRTTYVTKEEYVVIQDLPDIELVRGWNIHTFDTVLPVILKLNTYITKVYKEDIRVQTLLRQVRNTLIRAYGVKMESYLKAMISIS